MKILIAHNTYLSRYIGGEDIVFRQELAALQEQLGEENVFSYSVSNDHINRLTLPFTIWFSFKHYRAIYELVKKHQIDILHVHNFFPLLTPSVFFAAKKAGAKVVQTLHNFRWWCLGGILYRESTGACELCTQKTFSLPGIKYRCYRDSFFQSLIAAFTFSFYKLFHLQKNIDRFFVLSEFQKKKLLKFGVSEKRIFHKPNFLTFASGRIKLEEKKDFLFIGRLEQSKGIVTLLEEWEKLGEEFILNIIGKGPLEGYVNDYVEKNSKRNVFYHGKQSTTETSKWIGRSKFLIQPSLWYETFGLTIVDALAAGTPVIGFPIGTRPEMIQNNINGFLVEPSSLHQVIQDTRKLKNYNQLSANAIESSRKYIKERVISLQIQAYNSLCEDRN